jgi:undecaprenyl-diphosphatase
VPLLHLIILAIVQGVTEFLPISSSGHLVLTWELLDTLGANGVGDAERLDLDIAAHVGTLMAVCLYFRRDIAEMIAGLPGLLRGRPDRRGQLALFVVAASLPVVVAGYVMHELLPGGLRSLAVVAWANILFALVLWLADRVGASRCDAESLGLGRALLIGLAQILALVPGTSRSGVTMTAGRFLGLTRPQAARFAMLLAIPAIAGAGVLAGFDLAASGDLSLGHDAVVVALLSFLAALAAIALLMRWLARASFTPFVVYRLLFGAVLLGVFYA